MHYPRHHFVDVDSAKWIAPEAHQMRKVCPASIVRSETQDSTTEAVCNNNNNNCIEDDDDDANSTDDVIFGCSSSSSGSNSLRGLHGSRRSLFTGKDAARRRAVDWLPSVARQNDGMHDIASEASVDEHQRRDNVPRPQQGDSSGVDDTGCSCCDDVTCTTSEVRYNRCLLFNSCSTVKN